ncbi:hypothetical protein [Flavihumibacter sp. CACIAM 22H1]|uniref:hypothetical protein n=1 Tax=Flavihumibacter sp. CACIAM 22H1 TaxID=1812911 RepID=UPI000AB21787|nr:hypothetical protein [Flavihumibacter sp. CACIAM 22H1]
MKKTVFGMMMVAVAAISTDANAQRIRVESGSIGVLAGEKEINTEFVYEGMSVGKFKTEAEYVAKKTADYNKKEPGRGDNWAKSWVADREARFHPKFNELFASESGIASGNAPSAKYTMIVKTISTEPGFNVGISRGNANIYLDIVIVETANRSKEVAKIKLEKALGRTFGGFDFDTGMRIGEAYADAGKALGAYFRKNL